MRTPASSPTRIVQVFRPNDSSAATADNRFYKQTTRSVHGMRFTAVSEACSQSGHPGQCTRCSLMGRPAHQRAFNARLTATASQIQYLDGVVHRKLFHVYHAIRRCVQDRPLQALLRDQREFALFRIGVCEATSQVS